MIFGGPAARAAVAGAAASALLALAAPGAVAGQTGADPSDGASIGVPALSVEVPFVPQGELLCGGAAAAMVLRYHGERGVGARAFAHLVRRDEQGIRTDDLAAELERAGWSVTAGPGDLDALARALAAGEPAVVLIGSGRARWHYVVVVGLDAGRVRVHDPALGPDVAIEQSEFLGRWDEGHRWMMLVRARMAAPAGEPPVPTTSADEAGDAPPSPALLAASERFRASDWAGAASAARSAVAAAPADARAWRLLASSLYLAGRREEALRAWTRVGEPRIDGVAVSGLERTRPRVVHELLGLEPGETLEPDDLARARRRLALLDLPLARIDYRAESGGWVQVEAAVLEPPAHPFTRRGLAAMGLGAATGELELWESGLAGAGERLEARWRPGEGERVELLAPGVFGRPGRTEVGMARAAAWDAAWLRATDWAAGWLRWELGARLDRAGGSARASLTGALQAAAGDRVGVRLGGDIGGGETISALGALDLELAQGTALRPWSATLRVGARGVTRGAPAPLRPTAGDRGQRALAGAFAGADPTPLLRAHVDVDGSRMLTGGVEATRWAGRTLRFGAASFLDAAVVGGGAGSRRFADVGVGARVALPGLAGAARVDHAWGLLDGGRRWSVGWTLPGGARLGP